MRLDSVQDWIVSSDGLANNISELRTWSARRAFYGAADRERTLEAEEDPDWARLLLAASVLAESESEEHKEAALMIAQAAVAFSSDTVVQDSGALVLTQLSNMRALDLAQRKELVSGDLDRRLGANQQLITARRILESSHCAE